MWCCVYLLLIFIVFLEVYDVFDPFFSLIEFIGIALFGFMESNFFFRFVNEDSYVLR